MADVFVHIIPLPMGESQLFQETILFTDLHAGG